MAHQIVSGSPHSRAVLPPVAAAAGRGGVGPRALPRAQVGVPAAHYGGINQIVNSGNQWRVNNDALLEQVDAEEFSDSGTESGEDDEEDDSVSMSGESEADEDEMSIEGEADPDAGEDEDEEDDEDEVEVQPQPVVTRSGRQTRQPVRFETQSFVNGRYDQYDRGFNGHGR